MRRLVLIALLALVAAPAAFAATLTVVSDKPTYLIGETITLTVTGDSQGAADITIFGRLTYEAALTSTVSSSQTTHTSPVFGAWSTGFLGVGDGFATAFSQVTVAPATVQQLQIATVKLTADAAGTVHVSWLSSPSSLQLDFFGLTSANKPGTQATFTIVPEPTITALLGLALIGLALGGGRRF